MKTYIFKTIVTCYVSVEADNDLNAYEKVEEIDPLTGDLDYQEYELFKIEDEEGNDITEEELQ
jgi:hypothetical protein